MTQRLPDAYPEFNPYEPSSQAQLRFRTSKKLSDRFLRPLLTPEADDRRQRREGSQVQLSLLKPVKYASVGSFGLKFEKDSVTGALVARPYPKPLVASKLHAESRKLWKSDAEHISLNGLDVRIGEYAAFATLTFMPDEANADKLQSLYVAGMPELTPRPAYADVALRMTVQMADIQQIDTMPKLKRNDKNRALSESTMRRLATLHTITSGIKSGLQPVRGRLSQEYYVLPRIQSLDEPH